MFMTTRDARITAWAQSATCSFSRSLGSFDDQVLESQTFKALMPGPPYPRALGALP
jgi:hypothetical protein